MINSYQLNSKVNVGLEKTQIILRDHLKYILIKYLHKSLNHFIVEKQHIIILFEFKSNDETLYSEKTLNKDWINVNFYAFSRISLKLHFRELPIIIYSSPCS